MRRIGIIALFVCLAVACSAAADNILPVLQTPKPQVVEAPSFHALRGEAAPEPEAGDGGTVVYQYTGVGYSEYLDFGRLFAQEGYELADSRETGSVMTAALSKGHASLEVAFNQDEKTLKVTYGAWARPGETGAAPDPAQASVLPELTQAISFEAVTAVVPGNVRWGGTQYCHEYSGVSYAAYERFGEALGDEGYTLVSAETLPDGTNRAKVAKGEITLTLDYYMPKEQAKVYYFAGVHPREADLYGDFTEVFEGEPVSLTDGVTLTLLGWQKADAYKLRVNGIVSTHAAKNGQKVLLRFAVRMEDGGTWAPSALVKNLTMRCEKKEIDSDKGVENSEATLWTDSLNSPIDSNKRKEFVLAVGAELTEEQLQRPEEVAFTFSDADNAVRYVTYLRSPVDEATRKRDKKQAQWAAALAGGILANASDALEDPGAGKAASYYSRFIDMDFLHPDKVIVIPLTVEQAEAAQKALGAEGKENVASALANFLNRDYPDYAAAADRAHEEYSFGSSDGLRGLVILPCGSHIAIASFWDKQASASLIISMPESSAALGAKDIREYAAQIGLSGLRIRVYEGEERDALLDIPNFGGDQARYLESRFGSSLSRLTRLFGHLTGAGVPRGIPYIAIRNLLQNMETADLTTVRKVTELLPRVDSGDKTPALAFLSANDFANTKKIPVPEFSLSDEAPEQETAPDPDGTYIFVRSCTMPSGKSEAWTELMLEAVLPAECIPETPEAADYVIRMATEYDRTDVGLSTGRSGNGVKLHYPLTHTTVHDAKTGAMLKDIGWSTRTLSGIVMLPRGDTYWDPYNSTLWNWVKALFGE